MAASNEDFTLSALLPLVIGDRSLAVDALAVVEILGPQRWVAIPGAPPPIPGALPWRGRALAILDLGPELGQGALHRPETRNRNVVVRITDDTVILSVDRVLEVRSLGAAELQPVHAADLLLPCLGEVVINDSVVAVVDLDRWVRSKRGSG